MTIYVDTLIKTRKGELCRLGTDDADELNRLSNMARNTGFNSLEETTNVYFLEARHRTGALRLGARPISAAEFDARCLVQTIKV